MKIASPRLTVWYAPRRTVRRVLDSGPGGIVMPILAVLAGIDTVLISAGATETGDRGALWQVLAFVVVLGPVVGLPHVYVGGALNRWAGGLIGGSAVAIAG